MTAKEIAAHNLSVARAELARLVALGASPVSIGQARRQVSAALAFTHTVCRIDY